MKRYRIALDARMDKPWRTGLGRYARGLCDALTRLDAPGIQWVIIKHPTQESVRFAAEGSDAQEVTVAGDLDTPANFLAARALNRLNLDLYHALENFVPPGLRARRIVITMHDLVYLDHPELIVHSRWGALQREGTRVFGVATMRHALRRANATITVSEATRQAALARFSWLDPSTLRTIHHGVERQRFPQRKGSEPAEPFFLSIGNSRPYKNFPVVIDALARTRDVRLEWIVAGRGDCYDALAAHAQKLGVADRVRLLVKPTDATVLDLLHRARALVAPSLVEGFGFPLIEAMCAGCPVVASDIPVFREVCRDAAWYVDPRDAAALATALDRIACEPGLRQELRARGALRADAFDWARTAAQTLDVYRSVL